MTVMLVRPFTDVNDRCKNAPRPEVGDIDVVTDSRHNHEGNLYYYLARFGRDYAYQADLFAPLPDTPAELIEEGIEEPETVEV